MKQHDEFIAAYKGLEEAILSVYPEAGKESSPVKWAEDHFTEKSSRLRYCRITRNYIQHEGDYEKFIAVSPEMTAFLKEMTGELTGTAKSLSKSLKTYAVFPSDPVKDAAVKMKKMGGKVPVMDEKEVYGILYDGDIRLCFAEGKLTARTKVSSLLLGMTKKEIGEVSGTDSGSKVNKMLETYTFLAVRNKQGKIVGVI